MKEVRNEGCVDSLRLEYNCALYLKKPQEGMLGELQRYRQAFLCQGYLVV